MALGITWNFAKPTEFSNLNTKMNATNAAAEGLGTIIGRVHDAILDEELAKMLDDEGNQKRVGEIDSRIAEIDAQIAEIKNKMASIGNAAAETGLQNSVNRNYNNVMAAQYSDYGKQKPIITSIGGV